MKHVLDAEADRLAPNPRDLWPSIAARLTAERRSHARRRRALGAVSAVLLALGLAASAVEPWQVGGGVLVGTRIASAQTPLATATPSVTPTTTPAPVPLRAAP